MPEPQDATPRGFPRTTVVATALACLLFAAHGVRGGEWGLAGGLALLLALIPSRRGWIRWALAGALAWAALANLDTAVSLVRVRAFLGEPWWRLAGIMGGVIALDLAALALLLGSGGRRFFHKDAERAAPLGAAFLLATFGLSLARAKASIPVLMLDRFAPGWGGLAVCLLGLYAVWIAGLFLQGPKKHRAVRPLIWGFFSAVFFGQLALGLAGWDIFLMTGKLHLPVPALILGGPLYRGHGLFMLILFSASVLLAGPAWCSHLCYIGAWDDAMSRRAKADGKPKKTAPLGRWPLYGRGATLLLTVVTATGLRAAGVPGETAVLFAAGFGLMGVGIMVFVSRRAGHMAHCSAFCPMGLMGNLLGKLSPWRMRMDEHCTRCGVCTRSCRYGALTARDIARSRPGLSCTLCGDCVSGCPHKAMHYTLPGLPPEAARTAFLVLVASLHAIFLGVARI